MGILGGDSFSLPVAQSFDVVDVNIEVTESARVAIKEAIGADIESHVLIISAQSGGCSGYLYDMKIVECPEEEGFQTILVDQVKVLVHDKDSVLLNGLSLDFKDSLMGGGFQMNNPNADRSCGCGQSFG